jgi:deoxycytidylate deaminase
MSPRNDTFLSLCLAQAEQSPLHYRHGAIIVRGGKIIGQGFNSYRPGFDGGALKTGVLASGSLDGPAIAEFKQRLKSKPKPKSKLTLDNQQDSGTFMPFESMGNGHNANTPLSLHSEMMAIQSALSLSSGTLSSQTSARSAKYYQKPCFSLSGDSKKRKARARGLKAYAEAVFAEATETGTVSSYSGKFSIQKQGFEPGSSQPGAREEQQQVRQRGGGQCVSGGQGGRGFEHMQKYREIPTEEEAVRVSVSEQYSASLLSSHGSTEALST